MHYMFRTIQNRVYQMFHVCYSHPFLQQKNFKQVNRQIYQKHLFHDMEALD